MNKLKLKKEFFSIFLIALSFLVSIYFYRHFSEMVPVHWDIKGNANGFASKTVGAFLFPIIILATYLLFLILPFLDPKRGKYKEFKKSYNFIKNILVLFFLLVYIVASFNALGYNISVVTWDFVLIGFLLMAMGNYMDKIKSNWFVGIKNPWTLSSEDNWNKTHKFSKKIFLLSGLFFILIPFMPEKWQLVLFVLVIFIMVVFTNFYSYIYYLKEKKKKDEGN